MIRETFLILGVFITVQPATTFMQPNTQVQAQQIIPAYAKWGKLAMKEVQSKYPNASIIDYLHEGNESDEDATIEKFKLWLKDGNKEFGVFVRIKYTTNTEQVITIELEETSR